MKEIYQVLSAALGEESRLDQIANNLANVSTVGFKQDKAIFENYLKLAQPAAPGSTPTGAASTPSISDLTQAFTDFSQHIGFITHDAAGIHFEFQAAFAFDLNVFYPVIEYF